MATVTPDHDILLFKSASELFEAAADDFMRRSNEAVEQRGECVVVLSGGHTPKCLFDCLTSNARYLNNIPWPNIHFYFGDERYVAMDDARNNGHMAYEHLFSKVPVKSTHIHRIRTDFSDPKQSAADYDTVLRQLAQRRGMDVPLFDWVYLGLGSDAHTASLMPFNEVLKQLNDHWVLSLWAPELNEYRVTITPAVISQSREIIFLVTGAEKSSAVANVLQGPWDPSRYPAQLIQCEHGRVRWYLETVSAKLPK